MKILSRDFTRTEKILIVVLALILVGLAYYQFVDVPVRTTINNVNSEANMLQTELNTKQARLAQVRNIETTMSQLEAEGKLSYMGSYNNSKAEVAELNNILANTLKYTITFANVTRTGNQIRRSFTLDYQTPDYQSAQDVVAALCANKNRCLVGDITCNINSDGYVTVKQTATFYETMVDGMADAALPVDTAAINE